MATSDGFPIAIVVTFICVYFLIFLSSIVGNSFVLWLCYKLKRQRESSLTCCIANLAIADVAFTVLSIFDLVTFLWTWVGGEISCKLQRFSIEACYSTSILTLVLISFERLKAVVDPLSVRLITKENMLRKLIAVWSVSAVVASPLLYAYQTQTDDTGTVFCTNSMFGDIARQIYYTIHAFCFFLVPLVYMIVVQKRIFLSLSSSVASNTSNIIASMRYKRHYKMAKVLAALTIAFVTCWSPFMVTRTLLYFHLTNGGYGVWRASQLLILLNTVLDPMLYGVYGEAVRRYARSLFKKTGWTPFPRVDPLRDRQETMQVTDSQSMEVLAA
nr:growth hormone secretagogue receptor type 1-like [Pocillopora verrucosa]